MSSTRSWNLLPVPRWYFADNYGNPLGAGQMFTYSSLNKTLDKPVFQDPNGMIPWSNPVDWNLNGMQGPFYWEFDTSNPADLYYIEVFDKNGELVFTQDGYGAPGSGGGGGGPTIITSNNLITNNVFINNVGTITPPVGTTVIAPGAHSAFSTPDVTFIKATSNAVDSLSFPLFTQGLSPLNGDNTPFNYLEYVSNAATVETLKCVQFPIQPHVKSMELQNFTFTIWAMSSTIGSVPLTLQFVQHFGSGGAPSPDVVSVIQIVTLSSTWTQYTASFPVPSTAGQTLGTSGDDGSYLQIAFPPETAVNVSLTKPCCYFGNLVQASNMETTDQIDAVIYSPRTGDFRSSTNNFVPFGWVADNVGGVPAVINRGLPTVPGHVVSRANIDTYFLFALWWANPNLIMYNTTGAVQAKGANASADFALNYSMAAPATAGRFVLHGQN
jgi:hypothetical protein